MGGRRAGGTRCLWSVWLIEAWPSQVLAGVDLLWHGRLGAYFVRVADGAFGRLVHRARQDAEVVLLKVESCF